ncbi:T9SS type A sorting domain-containing protein [Algoriphagus terrigena]|uniref:T9SS type A sorting domain-containing protein n=1 Tax=Algoriphagus terrigena TaxID=344884 RepID=UPI000417B195|nr:T9SS type A sorting domain-containing protein [Algoriphagus terrigena]
MKKRNSRFGRILFPFILVLLFGLETFAAKRYASPTGNVSNAGTSEAAPWNLAFAFQQNSPLAPGDSLILLDGIYEGNFVLDKSGTSQSPIFILPKNEGKAIFDTGKNRVAETGITVNGSYVWLIGLHLTSSSTVKREDLGESVPYEAGITVFGVGVKLINCWIYDIPGGGLQLWKPALDLEVYGCVIFNNGSQASLRGTGHGMYIQHDDPSRPKVIRNNIVFQNASQGINIYTSNPINGGINSLENIAFNTGAIANFNPSVFRPPHNLTIGSQSNESFDLKVDKNVFYADLQGGRLSKTQVSNVSLGRTYQPNKNISFTNNLLYGGGNQLEIQPVEKLRLTGNKFYNVHGKFFQFLSVPSAAIEVVWNENQYFNIEKNATPFTGANFSDWKSKSGFDAGSSYSEIAPNTPQIFVRRNEYDPRKFYVTIVNPQKQTAVEVAFSDFNIPAGSSYRILDIQNPFDASLDLKGVYSGGKVVFPMNLTKSLPPKGNMPHRPVHTDSQFAVFQIQFESEVSLPVFEELITVELGQDGKVSTTLADYLKNEVKGDWKVTFSRSPEYTCADLAGTQNEVKITDSKGNIWTKTVIVKVKDNIPPKLTLKPHGLQFDLVKGFLEFTAEDFVSSVTDNCGVKSLTISRNRIGCSEYQLPIEVVLEAVDNSGNQTREVITLNLSSFESKKISISPESGKQFTVGQQAEIRLGSEFEFTLEGWYRNGQRLAIEKGNAILTDEPGTYWAKLFPKGSDCTVESMKTEINFSSLPFGGVKESHQLVLGPDGKAELRPQDVFSTWPLSDPSLVITLGKTLFSCENIGDNQVTILIKKPGGETWERTIKVIVKDQTKPVLVPKNITLDLDVSKGVVEITPQSLLAEFGDNCGIKSLTINKNRFTCEDVGKEFSVAIRAEDNSGNVTEAVAVVSVIRSEPEKVLISGKSELCAGEKTILELSSSKAFEVVRWRRNGVEIQSQTGKTLEVSEAGNYHAVIRYAGGCLSETEAVEVKVSPIPAGEIAVDGNILRAPEGNFSYQWFRNGEKINGATNRVFTADQMGEYTVELTNEAGCKTMFEAVTLTISGIIGRPVNPSVELKLYPNPASDRVTIELPDGVLRAKPNILVYSSEGKNVSSVVQITVLTDSKVEISLNRMSKGTYLIWIIGENQKTYFGKLVVVN